MLISSEAGSCSHVEGKTPFLSTDGHRRICRVKVEDSIGQTGCVIDARSALDKQLSSERDLCSAINTDSLQEGLLRPSTLAQSQVHHRLFFLSASVSFFMNLIHFPNPLIIADSPQFRRGELFLLGTSLSIVLFVRIPSSSVRCFAVRGEAFD